MDEKELDEKDMLKIFKLVNQSKWPVKPNQ